MAKKQINSHLHKSTRAHIPSKEEAGYEDSNPKVQEKKEAIYPKNPVIHRGQDPELFWLNKNGENDTEDMLKVDIRSLYRHEHISPEVLIKNLYRYAEQDKNQGDLFGSVNEMFGNALDMDEIDKVSEYYKHQDGWSNRLIQGDSLLVMNSLLQREGMAGQVQTIYIDPPYGIKYGSNWQMKLNNRDVKDGNDEHLTGEPEMIKAYRDTWELGIHSYLSYLRDRLLVAKELLTESGSCFVQISDENVHLVRNLMDEVFGSENFASQIIFKTTAGKGSSGLDRIYDCILWYSKSEDYKYRQLYGERDLEETDIRYSSIEFEDNTYRRLSKEELNGGVPVPSGKRFRITALSSQGETAGVTSLSFKWGNIIYNPPKGRHWSVTHDGLKNLDKKNRLIIEGKSLCYKRYLDDYPVSHLKNVWLDAGGGALVHEKQYVVQTTSKVITRCILMTTDPGDLVLDPTCGSGTTAYVAEQWGRRWITIDTSRIALNIAKTRLTTAVFPYYKLYDEENEDIRQGFIYKTVPHITLKSLANDEPPEEETLYDQPNEDKKKLRVTGPFTVETLQNYEPLPPEELDAIFPKDEEFENFEGTVFEHLLGSGIKNGIKNEHAKFIRVDRLSSAYLHAEGFYKTDAGERKAYIHIGPKFGSVSKKAVNEAIKECRVRGDADWLIILGFAFESSISNENVTTSMGSFEVTRTRMHDDLMQDGLLKRDKKAASFVTIGEPDIKLHKNKKEVTAEILGLDIYDPVKDIVNARSAADIAYWMLDDDYDGNNFVVKQVFFCGGNKDEFNKWQKGLDNLAKSTTKKQAEATLKIEIDDEAFDRLYGFKSHPIEIKKKGQKIAIRVISQFGEESTKVMEL